MAFVRTALTIRETVFWTCHVCCGRQGDVEIEGELASRLVLE